MHPIQRYECHETSYIALLERTIYAKMITQQQYLEKKKQIEQMVQSLVSTFLRGRSSAISIKTYQAFAKSVLYTLDHAIPDSEQCSFLKTTSIADAYALGHHEIETIIDDIEAMYFRLKQRRWPFLNERYQSIFDQIVSFLTSYDATYYSYRCREDLDYPLLDGIPLQHHMYHKRGCDFVYEYVKRLTIEDQFIHRFDEDLSKLICVYEQRKGVNVALLGCSLCEIVFHQYLFHLLIENSSLVLDMNQHSYICKRIYTTSCDEVWTLMDVQMKQALSNEEYEYLQCGKEHFLQQLQIAIEVHKVEHLILCDSEEKTMHFSLKPSCDPAKYHALLRTLETLAQPIDKATAVLQSDLGFYDYIDVLEADILEDEDYQVLFHHMQDVQLMCLYAYVGQDILNFHQHISLSKEQLAQLPCTYRWQEQFYASLTVLSSLRKQNIVEMLKHSNICFS